MHCLYYFDITSLGLTFKEVHEDIQRIYTVSDSVLINNGETSPENIQRVWVGGSCF